jgi:CubicO group peptidase (beta-lactamase class C family)
MRSRLRARSFVLVLAATALPLAAQSPSRSAGNRQAASAGRGTISNGFDQWAEGLLKEWNIPGMAVGAVKKGEVALLKGYGFRNLDEKLPVTPQTLMAIGSNSKSFTVVLMAQLVDEGKLDWDKPVRDYLPDFQLWDEYATKNLRVKELVTHVSGLPRHDDMWYGRSFQREEIYRRLRYLEPTTSLRGRWQYNNLMFMTAGYLLERLTGKSWDALVQERIFRPLEMARSNTSTNAMPGSGDFSYPYQPRDGKLERVPFRNVDNVGPGGSINSSVAEMLNYIQMHINLGQWKGHRILSERNARRMQSPQSVVSENMDDPEKGPETYGLATWVSSYRGHKWVQHGGGIDGFISQMAWLPNDSIGVMVLTNMSGENNPVPNMVVLRVFDDLLGLEPIDHNARARKAAERGRARADSVRKKLEADRVAGTSPSHPLTDYAGRYHHDGYGTFEVAVGAGGGLVITVDGFALPVEHWHYDVFHLDPRKVRGAPFSGLIQFGMGTDGKVQRMAVPLETSLGPTVFEREKPKS